MQIIEVLTLVNPLIEGPILLKSFEAMSEPELRRFASDALQQAKHFAAFSDEEFSSGLDVQNATMYASFAKTFFKNISDLEASLKAQQNFKIALDLAELIVWHRVITHCRSFYMPDIEENKQERGK